MMGLRVPQEVIEQKCALYMQRGQPAQRAELLTDSDYSIVSKYQSDGPMTCLQVVITRENKRPLVARFGGIPLQRKQEAMLVDHQPQFLTITRSELLQRVYADQ